MKRLHSIAILLAGLAFAGPALAVDNSLSLKEAMTRFGLIGEWAAHCSQPTSGNNAHTFWSANSDTAGALFTDFGRGQTMSYTATAAELAGANQIRVNLTDDQDHLRLDLIIEMHDGRVRTVSSVRSDGRVLIKDGKFTSDNTDTVAQERCH